MRARGHWLGLLALVALTGSFAYGAAAGPGADPEVFTQLAQAIDQATLAREGGTLYTRNCAICHGGQGQGDMGPKLAGHEFLRGTGALIAQILHGAEDHGMPPFKDALNDRQIAAISTYVRNTWGNTFGIVVPADVAAAR